MTMRDLLGARVAPALLAAIGAGGLLALPALGASETEAKATFVDAEGERVGTATLTELADGVLIDADLAGLPPGLHAFHIHEAGTCDAASGFESAGGHYAPAGRPHGFAGEKGHHAGDMANQNVGRDGKLRLQVVNQRVTLDGDRAPLLDGDGSALVIHARADDHRSQPSGDAGDRIACAVIEAGT